MKKSIPISKRTILQLSIFILAAMASCKKEDLAQKPVAQKAEVDKQSFFTIHFNNKDYVAYGYYDNASPIPYGGPTLTQSTGPNATGGDVSFVFLTAEDSYVGRNSTGSNSISLGNCYLHLSMKKDGADLSGLYTEFSGYLSDQTINSKSAEVIYFDNIGCRLIIDRIVQHPSSKADMVEGSLSCRVYTSYGGSFQTFPAFGAFRMYLTK